MTHIETRKYLQNIVKISELKNLLSEILFTDNEYSLMEMYYLNHKPLDYIADILGLSYSNTKKIHRQALKKVGTYLTQN